jgi:hypothetical protein
VETGAVGIREFLERELPQRATDQVAHFTTALLEAGQRYDRLTARRSEWRKYSARKNRLKRITRLAWDLASALSELDVLSHDDLASRIGATKIDEFVGSLWILGQNTRDLGNEVQKDGRARDLAEERWISELADIYENAFGRPAGVWGSGSGPIRRRGNFFRLLEISRPTLFARYGKLSIRQIERKLKERRKPVGWAGLVKPN